MKIEDIKKMAQAWNSVQEASYGKKKEAMDPVDAKELKGKHKDRKDKDIDNDGDVDSSDEYLHKRRKAVSKAIKGKDTEVEVQTQESVDLDEVSMDTAKDVFMKRKMQALGAADRGDRKMADKLADKKNKTKAYIAKRESVEEAATATHKPNNGSPRGEGLSPSAKKELARTTPMNPATDEPMVNKKTFDAIRASGKKAPMRSNDNAQGDKTAPKTGK